MTLMKQPAIVFLVVISLVLSLVAVFQITPSAKARNFEAANSGLARAGVWANCPLDGSEPAIIRAFNNVNSKTIKIAAKPDRPGTCTVNFRFTIEGGYVVATFLGADNGVDVIEGFVTVSGTNGKTAGFTPNNLGATGANSNFGNFYAIVY